MDSPHCALAQLNLLVHANRSQRADGESIVPLGAAERARHAGRVAGVDDHDHEHRGDLGSRRCVNRVRNESTAPKNVCRGTAAHGLASGRDWPRAAASRSDATAFKSGQELFGGFEASVIWRCILDVEDAAGCGADTLAFGAMYNSASWKKLADFMLAAFQDMDPNVRLQAVKILENYIKGEGASDGASVFPENARMPPDGIPDKSSHEQALAALMVRRRLCTVAAFPLWRSSRCMISLGTAPSL